MTPSQIGVKYNKIADWWHKHHKKSSYGIHMLRRALQACKKSDRALDIGCGAGGRMIRELDKHQFEVEGIDVSVRMI
jgi:ubiquinone/menaquinone biosynthesis C-methylase UbiE